VPVLVRADLSNLAQDFFHRAFPIHAGDDHTMWFRFCLSLLRLFNPD
jgi:hypothetical protein